VAGSITFFGDTSLQLSEKQAQGLNVVGNTLVVNGVYGGVICTCAIARWTCSHDRYRFWIADIQQSAAHRGTLAHPGHLVPVPVYVEARAR